MPYQVNFELGQVRGNVVFLNRLLLILFDLLTLGPHPPSGPVCRGQLPVSGGLPNPLPHHAEPRLLPAAGCRQHRPAARGRGEHRGDPLHAHAPGLRGDSAVRGELRELRWRRGAQGGRISERGAGRAVWGRWWRGWIWRGEWWWGGGSQTPHTPSHQTPGRTPAYTPTQTPHSVSSLYGTPTPVGGRGVHPPGGLTPRGSRQVIPGTPLHDE